MKFVISDIIFSVIFSKLITIILYEKIQNQQVIYFLIYIFSLIVFLVPKSFSKNMLSGDKSKFKWIRMVVFIIIILTAGWKIVEIDILKLLSKFGNTFYIIKQILTPNWKNFFSLLNSLTESIFLALMATVFALPIAFLLSFFSAKNLMKNSVLSVIIYYFFRTITTVTRSVEAIVWAIICSVWVGIGPFAGMLALWIHSIAALTKLFSEQIENCDNGIIEAVETTGASKLVTWIYGVIPQIISPFLAFTMYRWDINVRMATIVGFVGGGGIGLLLLQSQQLMLWRNVGMIIWMIAGTVWIMDFISAKVRNYLMR